jgi:hypothetical protein
LKNIRQKNEKKLWRADVGEKVKKAKTKRNYGLVKQK